MSSCTLHLNLTLHTVMLGDREKSCGGALGGDSFIRLLKNTTQATVLILRVGQVIPHEIGIKCGDEEQNRAKSRMENEKRHDEVKDESKDPESPASSQDKGKRSSENLFLEKDEVSGRLKEDKKHMNECSEAVQCSKENGKTNSLEAETEDAKVRRSNNATKVNIEKEGDKRHCQTEQIRLQMSLPNQWWNRMLLNQKIHQKAFGRCPCLCQCHPPTLA